MLVKPCSFCAQHACRFLITHVLLPTVPQIHEIGRYTPEVERALKYMYELRTQFEEVDVLDEKVELYRGGTPAERFWSMPAICGGARTTSISPLIQVRVAEWMRTA